MFILHSIRINIMNILSSLLMNILLNIENISDKLIYINKAY